MPVAAWFGRRDQRRPSVLLGGYIAVAGDGLTDTGSAFDITGVDNPFAGLDWALNGGDSADNQNFTSSFVATSGLLPPDQFEQFELAVGAVGQAGWTVRTAPGEQYVHSQIADESYKRLTQEIAVPAGGGSMTFWTSYNTEAAGDHLFVEARTPGGDDWTTLPDANGHTTTETGDSRPEGWVELGHPQLAHYQTLDGEETCTSTGTSGEWNAASGASEGGWEQWSVDLSEWSGQTVEISIAYASDWSTQGLGVFLDDVALPDGTTTSFETGLDGWEVTGPPEGSTANPNNWGAPTSPASRSACRSPRPARS